MLLGFICEKKIGDEITNYIVDKFNFTKIEKLEKLEKLNNKNIIVNNVNNLKKINFFKKLDGLLIYIKTKYNVTINNLVNESDLEIEYNYSKKVLYENLDNLIIHLI